MNQIILKGLIYRNIQSQNFWRTPFYKGVNPKPIYFVAILKGLVDLLLPRKM